MKLTNKINKVLGILCVSLILTSCGIPKLIQKVENTHTPETYKGIKDTNNTAIKPWQEIFTDPYLVSLIDTALANNQELNIIIQEIEIARSEVRDKKGEYLPFVGLQGGAGVDKVGRYTRNGALEATTDIAPGVEFPEPLQDFNLGAYASWELDIWKKLRNAKKSAVNRFLASVEGKNFMTTQLISEIANSYYELLALDNQLAIIQQNIEIQSKALSIVKMQKQAAKVTELAVQKFEAEVYKNRSLQFFIQQEIIEKENEINFLVGRFPQKVERSSSSFSNLNLFEVNTGIPSQILRNRPDIKQAELELMAAKLDVKVARAQFYPSIGIKAGVGIQAFDPSYLIKTPESLLYSLAGDLVAPLINRNAIKAAYANANAKQIQAVYNYERCILKAFIEVSNQLSNIENLDKSYQLQKNQVEALTNSIKISTILFKSARADYMEVLLTQRDALEAKIELVETKQKQIQTLVTMYKALGGGWKQ